MDKKRFLIALLTMVALTCMIFAGCGKKDAGKTSSPKENVESIVESEESEPTSLPSSEELTVPTFEFTLDSTETSVIIVENENDPDNVGEISGIVIARGSNKTVIEDASTRTIDDLLSGVQYKVTVTYTYNVGDGNVSEDYTKTKYTFAKKEPTIEIEYEATDLDTISFELKIKDQSNVLNITSIYLIPDGGGDAIYLEDLGLREFNGLKNGFYEIVVEYEYDLNKGAGVVQKDVRCGVATKINPLSIVDFVVDVPVGKAPVILQITDTQIIDSSQYSKDISVSYYRPENFGIRLENYLRETVEAVKPDLIIMTGDNVYGKFDNSGASLTKLINLMESFEIPWAPVFGNHDNESAKGVAWQCAQYEAAEHCLFKRNTLEGNGNYTVGIAQGGKLTRVFFMMDSNCCASPSQQSSLDGQMRSQAGFGEKQIAWFEKIGALLGVHSPETKVSFAFHIQIQAFTKAYAKYGYSSSTPIVNIDKHADKEEGDFGYVGGVITGTWDNDGAVFAKMKAIGCDSIYIGHEHFISASVVYEGVRFQFGQKIGTYDEVNWLLADGSVVKAFSPNNSGDPIMGGSVNVLDSTGAIVNGYIYFCGGISHNGKAE